MIIKNKIKAVIFDMDGVIVDSEPIHSSSWETLIKQYGKKPIFNEQGTIHTIGDTGDESYLRIIKKHKLEDDLNTVREKRRKIYEEILINTKLSPMPGFIILIKLLKKEKIKTAIASSRNLKHVLLTLNNLGVKKYFDVVLGKSLDRRSKPHPDIYLHTAKELKVNPLDCVAIEDSTLGVLSAYNASMKVIAVPTKRTIHHDFSKADKIVGNLSEITLELLNNL